MYEKTEQDLRDSGLFSIEEIEDAGFSQKSLKNLSIQVQAQDSSDNEDGSEE